MFLDVAVFCTVYFLSRSVKIKKRTGFLLKKLENKSYLEKLKNENNIYLPVGVGLSVASLTLVSPLYPFVIHPLQVCMACYLLFPIFKQAEYAVVQEKKLRAPILTSIFLLSCVATNSYIALGLGSIFFVFAKNAVDKAKDDLKNNLTTVFHQLPDTVWLIQGDAEIETLLLNVALGDVICVNSGGVIPVDGVIVQGSAVIDQHQLTGEFQPAEKTVGDKVLSSTTVMSGQIKIKIEQTGEDTTAAKIDTMLKDTADFKSSLQLRGEVWSDKAVLPTLLASAITLPYLHITGIVAILNCGFENRILMLAPLGTLNYLELASKHGIFVKDGRALEMACQVDTVLFDKTGTLTDEAPKLGSVVACEGYTEQDILSYAATAECKMSHPIAQSIIQAAQERKIEFTEPEASDYTLGYGITVKLKNQLIHVGSARFMALQEIEIENNMQETITVAQEQGYSTIMIAIDEKVAGMIELRPALRPEVVKLMADLRLQGVKQISLVSGDNEIPVRKMAQELGMDSYFSEVLPEDKAQIVQQLRDTGKTVCFIGDGINDSIAMKKANLSVSLTGATSVATDVAQVVLMSEGLSNLCELMHISKALQKNSRRTLGITLAGTTLNLAGILFFNFGIISTIIVNIVALTAGGANAMLPTYKK